MELIDYLIFGGALFFGGLAGWWARGRRHLTERRVLNELYMRKVRLAETEHERAIRTLNENQVAMKRVESRTEAFEAEIKGLETQLLTARNEASMAGKNLLRSGEELETARAEASLLRAEKERITRLAGRAEELDRGLNQARSDLDQLRREAVQGEAKVRELRARVDDEERTRRDLSERAEMLEDELAAARSDLENLRREKTAGEERMHALGEELQEVERLRGVVAELDGTLTERDEELAVQRTRVEELVPQNESLEQVRQELAAELEESRQNFVERAGAWSERELGLTEKGREVERQFAEAIDRNAELARRVATLEVAGKRADGEHDALEERLDRRERELAEARVQKTEADERSAEMSERVAALEARDKRYEGEIEKLETKLGRREEELAALEGAKAAAKRLGTELVRIEKHEGGLEDRLDKERERTDSMRERLHTTKEREAERKREFGDLKDRLAKLSASHKAAQLKLDRYAKRMAELEETLAEHKGRAKASAQEVRERDVRVRGLEAQLERATSRLERVRGAGQARPAASGGSKKAAAMRPPRDELQELAGVGPTLEKKLNRAGLRTFAQIARLDRDGIEELAERIGTSPQTIRSKRWVATARRAHNQKYGTPVGR